MPLQGANRVRNRNHPYKLSNIEGTYLLSLSKLNKGPRFLSCSAEGLPQAVRVGGGGRLQKRIWQNGDQVNCARVPHCTGGRLEPSSTHSTCKLLPLPNPESHCLRRRGAIAHSHTASDSTHRAACGGGGARAGVCARECVSVFALGEAVCEI